eukprot:g749.t1
MTCGGRCLCWRRRKWARRTVLATLFWCYVAVYFCRANLTVSGPVLKQLPIVGSSERFGAIISCGTFVYGIGKMLSGQTLRGRSPAASAVVMRIGLSVTSVATFLFATSQAYWALIVTWSLSRFFQSLIWTCMTAILSHWFAANERGRAVAAVSQAFLIGDALARVTEGSMLDSPDIDWRGVSCFGATVLVIMTIVSCWTLKPTPQSAGLSGDGDGAEEGAGGRSSHQTSRPGRVDSTGSDEALNAPVTPGPSSSSSPSFSHPPSSSSSPGTPPAKTLTFLGSLRVVCAIPEFWVVCAANGGLNFAREVFRDWVPILLTDRCGIEEGTAGVLSIVFPISGALSALLLGFATDRARRRGPLMTAFTALAVVSVFILALIAGGAGEEAGAAAAGNHSGSSSSSTTTTTTTSSNHNITTMMTTGSLANETDGGAGVKPPADTTLAFFVLLCVAGVSLGIVGPYSLLTTLTLDICDTPARRPVLPVFQGLQDGAGYLVAAVSGILVGDLVDEYGWGSAIFLVLGAIVLGMLMCLAYSFHLGIFGEPRLVFAEAE